MDANDMADVLERDPFVPVAIRLTDGEEIVIVLPHRTMVTQRDLIVSFAKDPYAVASKRRRRYIPFDEVDSIKDLARVPRRRNGKK